MRVARVLALALLAALSVGCGRDPGPTAGSSTARPKDAPAEPRIVSVGGTVTEIIFALGQGARVVAVDTSSTHPAESTDKLPKIGYQRTLAAEGIVAQRPTLLLLSAEAGPPATIEQLKGLGVATHILPAEPTVEGTKERIRLLAEALGAAEQGKRITADLTAELGRSEELVKRAKTKPRVLFVYARGAGTLMVGGARTPAAEMIRLAGGENAVDSFEGFKPLTSEAVTAAKPDVIVIPERGLASLGGVAGLTAQPGVGLTPAGKAGRVVAMDDLLLLGFGPRLGRAVRELASRIHPDLATEAP